MKLFILAILTLLGQGLRLELHSTKDFNLGFSLLGTVKIQTSDDPTVAATRPELSTSPLVGAPNE